MKSSSMVFLSKKIIVILSELLILCHLASDFKVQSAAQNAENPLNPLSQAEVSSVNLVISQLKSRKMSTYITASYCSNIVASYGFQIACNCESTKGKPCHISTIVFTSSGLSGTISEATGDLIGLTRISLADNKLTGQIPISLGSLTNLVTLDLSHNQLTGNIPATLGQLKSLKFLYLQYNFLQGSIPPSLGDTSLRELFLDYNKLSGSIPNSLGKLSNLTYLQLSENRLNGKLPEELGDLTNLVSFWMPSNYFRGELPKRFENLVNLTWFGVAGNNLDGPLPNIEKWTTLRALWLQGNKFKGPLPPQYFKMPALEQLLISDLQGGESQLPDEADITRLIRLVLRSCSLSGTFPKFISELQSLVHLDLSFNKLIGAIPDSMRPNFLYMSLARNNFNGTIPLWVTEASGGRMDLSYNNFSKLESPVTSDQDVNLFSCCCCEFSQGAIEPYMLSPMSMMKFYFGDEKPMEYSLYINSGGEQTKSNGTKYEADNSTSPVYVSPSHNWAYSFSGDYLSTTVTPSDYTRRIPCKVYNSETSVYEDARLSPVSLDYYGFNLIKGSYNVTLYFAEIIYSNKEDYSILRKRFFDIQIQDQTEKDFSIRDHAGGPNEVTSWTVKAEVNESGILSIHLYWAGKGSYLEPPTFNGPLISAISVDPLFKVKFPQHLTPWEIALISLASLVVATLLFLALAWSLGWLEKKEYKKNIKVGERLDSNNLMEHLQVTLRQLVTATGNFSDENKIGSDSLGELYKANIERYNVNVSVKKFYPRFKGKILGPITKETHVLTDVKSRNLVRLFDAHVGESLQLCVYEYVEKGSLETALFEAKTGTITWDTRYNICLGIAEGLESLHEHHTRIVHGNLKCSNILFDKDYNPKLSDFGYSSIYSDEDKFSVIKKEASRGHLAPEYCLGEPVSIKTDIFSFGVILLEIVAGHRNNEMSGAKEKDLIDKIRVHCREKRASVSEFVDRRLKHSFNTEQVERVLSVAELCTNTPSLRPGIADIVSCLQGEKTVGDISRKGSGVESVSSPASSSFK